MESLADLEGVFCVPPIWLLRVWLFPSLVADERAAGTAAVDDTLTLATWWLEVSLTVSDVIMTFVEGAACCGALL